MVWKFHTASEFEALRREDEALRSENEVLRQRVDVLTARVAELERQLAEAVRAGKRQAAPFSRGKRKTDPKRPGRKKGHKGARRSVPASADRTVVSPPLVYCPKCGGAALEDVRVVENYQTDIPPVAPVVTRFIFQVGYCPDCNEPVFSTHPDQTSTATGAAASHIGPSVKALAAELKHRTGVPYRKIVDILEVHFGLDITAGGLAHIDEQLSGRAAPTLEAMRQELAREPLVSTDETGWRVNAGRAWLWDICSERFTLYEITPDRNAAVVGEVLGEDFAGWLMRDGWASYDKQLGYRMLRCLQHLRKNTQTLEKSQTKGAVNSPRQFLAWLADVFRLKHEAPGLTEEGYAHRAEALVDRFDRFLERDYSNELNRRFAERLSEARDQIIPIVEQPDLPATNALGERQIRPAVLFRKISAGNKTWSGAQHFKVLASIAATCRQLGVNFADVIHQVLLGPAGEPVIFWTPRPATT